MVSVRKIKPFFYLLKPMIMGVSLLASMTGMLVSDLKVNFLSAFLGQLGIALTIGAACALNMYIERSLDSKMQRTKFRPIPAGDIKPSHALTFGIIVALTGFILMYSINMLLGNLGLICLLLYVVFYTPLKTRTPLAVLIGMIPGAAPPLMGWVITGRGIEGMGLWLFVLLFLWQLPHVLAISCYLNKDYSKAGIITIVEKIGLSWSKCLAVCSSIILILATTLFAPLNMLQEYYFYIALITGVLYLILNIKGYESNNNLKWAYRIKRFSLVHLVILFMCIIN